MPKRFFTVRLFGFLAVLSCTFATLAAAAQVAPPKQETGDTGIIILDASDNADGQKAQLPPVVFNHDAHTRNDKGGDTCASCHDGKTPAAAASFKGTAEKTGPALVNEFHAGCTSCHESMLGKKQPSGPSQTECRSCHDAAKVPPAKATRKNKADGGLDAALHARHVASPHIVMADKQENCTACHHPVNALSSPKLKADSCRSCHSALPIGKKTAKQTPFAAVAHDTCISCHVSLVSAGVVAPVTCASCHDPAVKVERTRPATLPRLEAGQPDSVVMGTPPSPDKSPVPMPPQPLRGTLPDPALDARTQQQPSMPPVVFDHKLHEASVPGCVSCHHNTLQSCSTCHTPAGSPKGNNVTLGKAMHVASSPLSCVGCHEARKTENRRCAGCHSITPRTRAVSPDCATCHTPTTPGSKTDSAAQGAMPPAAAPNAATLPRGLPPETAAAIAAAPEKVRIAALAEEYEPVIFSHRWHLEKLANGIEKTSPGMMRFHAKPYDLCGSCHHASPPSASPPSCVSCHAKEAAPPASTRPQLKAAYHTQCMTCHTARRVKKVVNTDCTACHATRTPGR